MTEVVGTGPELQPISVISEVDIVSIPLPLPEATSTRALVGT